MKYFLVVIFSLVIFVQARPDFPEEDLLDEILYDYKKDARPATRYNPTVHVNHGITLLRIVSMKDDILTADVWQNLLWQDPRLLWDPADYVGIDSISLPVREIWKPDIKLYEGAGPTDGYTDKDVNVIVHYTGSVTWVPTLRLVTYCDESKADDEGAFTCKWKFGSWTLDASKVNLTNSIRNTSSSTPDIDLSSYTPSKEFSIVRTKAVLDELYYECCPEPYQDLTYFITFKRKDGNETTTQTTHVTDGNEGTTTISTPATDNGEGTTTLANQGRDGDGDNGEEENETKETDRKK